MHGQVGASPHQADSFSFNSFPIGSSDFWQTACHRCPLSSVAYVSDSLGMLRREQGIEYAPERPIGIELRGGRWQGEGASLLMPWGKSEGYERWYDGEGGERGEAGALPAGIFSFSAHFAKDTHCFAKLLLFFPSSFTSYLVPACSSIPQEVIWLHDT